MKNVGTYNDKLVYFTAIWYIFGNFAYIIWSFGVYLFSHLLYIFSHFGMLYQDKSGKPLSVSKIRP
jgi:hypothetical protein